MTRSNKFQNWISGAKIISLLYKNSIIHFSKWTNLVQFCQSELFDLSLVMKDIARILFFPKLFLMGWMFQDTNYSYCNVLRWIFDICELLRRNGLKSVSLKTDLPQAKYYNCIKFSGYWDAVRHFWYSCRVEEVIDQRYDFPKLLRWLDTSNDDRAFTLWLIAVDNPGIVDSRCSRLHN